MDKENKTEFQRSDNLPQREDSVAGNSRSDNPIEQRVDNPVAMENTQQRNDSIVDNNYKGEICFSNRATKTSVTRTVVQSKKKHPNSYLTIFIICLAIALISSTVLICSGILLYNSRNHELTFDANGGEGAPPAQTGNTYYIISSDEPSLSGCKFLGWSMNSDDCCASYHSGDDIDISSDATLYAVWVLNGDINKNGVVNEYDLSELEYYLYGDLLFDDDENKIADFNSDGWVDEEDLEELKAYLNLSEPTVDEVFSEEMYQYIDDIISQNQ